MEYYLFVVLVIVEIFFWLEEYVNAIFNFNSNNVRKATILKFEKISGRVFERRCYSVVEIEGKEFLIRRSICDAEGRNIFVFYSNRIEQNLKKPIVYRNKFEVIYIDIIQVLWHLTIIPILIIYYKTKCI